MNRAYQRGSEFKARQQWLDFQDAVGSALEAISGVVDKSRAWFKKWVRDFVTKEVVPDDRDRQMEIEFVINWRQRRAA